VLHHRVRSRRPAARPVIQKTNSRSNDRTLHRTRLCLTTASGPGYHHRVRSFAMFSRTSNDRTQTASGQSAPDASGHSRSLLEYDRTLHHRVRSYRPPRPVITCRADLTPYKTVSSPTNLPHPHALPPPPCPIRRLAVSAGSSPSSLPPATSGRARAAPSSPARAHRSRTARCRFRAARSRAARSCAATDRATAAPPSPDRASTAGAPRSCEPASSPTLVRLVFASDRFSRSALTLTLTLGFVGHSFVNEFRRESSSSQRARPVDSGNLAI
jgi:hypothetical protein